MFELSTEKGKIAFTFTHIRDVDVPINQGKNVITDVTVCKLVPPTAGLPILGVSTCSVTDNFNKEVGRKIALERALDTAPELMPQSLNPRQSTPERREIRRQIWKRYFARRQSNHEYSLNNGNTGDNAGTDAGKTQTPELAVA